MSAEAGNRSAESYSEQLRAFVEEAPLERRSIVEFVAAVAAGLPKGARVADVGAGGSPYRELFAHVDYVAIDREQTLHADAEELDIVASATDVPVPDGEFDAVISTQVLEHLPEPAAALREMHRIVRPGGRLFLSAPLVWEEHEMPHDYFRYTRSGLDHLLTAAGFEQLEIVPRTDGFTALAQLVSSARWSLGYTDDPKLLADDRFAAFRRLGQISDELAELAPLDARRSLTLGYTVAATRTAPLPEPAAGEQTAEDAATRAAAARSSARADGRIPVLYIAPWIDLGGSDKGTIDWFKHIDRSRFAPSIITTQPSSNRWLSMVEPYAEEVWALPDLMPGADFPAFVLGFIESRGVQLVHIMNSRLAFDLMPDMTCLVDPPAICVQLHAEEPDRSGYVRYSASRYGNLVDAFSVTSQQLADAMRDFEVPRSRMHVITTGVDGVDEFNPEHVEPFERLEGDGPRILWPGRLVAQKDPLLTLDVIKLLVDRGVRFTMDVVGDGEMGPEVRARARELGVDGRIRWHPASHEMPRWYRSDDVLLMTSVFEGVPYVMYEAQAMGMPIVVPAIPGNVEFLEGKPGGALIDPRDDAEAYADALQQLLEDAAARAAVGAAARERMLRECSLEEMGRRHDELYEKLLANRPVTARSAGEEADAAARAAAPPAPPKPVRFPRQQLPERSVAVIVPCYQHGRFIAEAINSLHDQTLRPRRIVVVDDASQDEETTTALAALDSDPRVTVLRMTENRGPSVARNRALALVRENYVLPLDADDMLLPRALEDMVEQLERAAEDVGFVYPNAQHFGNRHDYYEAPAYNLHLLLNDNYCAATSLFDARVFASGIRYPEEIVFGHEDWDLVLQMAEHEIYGEVADGPTFLYRKGGFSRVNAVEYGPDEFHKRIERRHPLLYRRRDQIKARWAPALSLLLVDGDGEWPEGLLDGLAEQSCGDFEIVRAGDAAPVPAPASKLSVTDVPGRGVERIAAAIAAARGRWVVVASPRAAATLARQNFVEAAITAFWHNGALERYVLAEVEDRRGVAFTPLDAEQVERATPCAVAWRRTAGEDDEGSVELGDGDVVPQLVAAFELLGPQQWRKA